MTTAVSLFAGIGGFDLALEHNGIHVSSAVEIDKPCQGILGQHFHQTQIFTDVQEITGDDIGQCDILTAGWPCQGNSVAGRREGMADPRSGLWSEVTRLLSDVRPQWFIGENVPGLLTVNGGADFYQVIKSLDELGYGYAWRVLDAQYFGVPQRRKRVFIVGRLGDGASPAEILLEPESGGGNSASCSEARSATSRAAVVSTLQGGGKRGYRVDAEGAAGGHLVQVFNPYQTSLGRGNGYVEGFKPDGIHDALTANPAPKGPPLTVAHTLTSGVATKPGVNPPGRRNEDDYNLVAVQHTANALTSHPGRNDREDAWVSSEIGVRRLTPRECERLQGFPDDWTAGQSDSARYRQLGNAVAVPVAEWVIQRILRQHLDSTSKALEAA